MASRTATASPGQLPSTCLLPRDSLSQCVCRDQQPECGSIAAPAVSQGRWEQRGVITRLLTCRINVVTKEDALEFIQTAEQRQHDEEQQQQHG